MTMKFVAGTALLVMSGILSGCEDGTLDETQFNSYDALSGEYERIYAEQAGMPLTAPGALPTSGGAVYEGVMNVIVQDGPAVTDVAFSAVGGLEVEVDFGNGTGGVAASADNFFLDDGTDGGTPVSGGGRLFVGFIDRGASPTVDQTFSMAFAPGFQVNGSALDGTMSGDFVNQSGSGTVPDGMNGVLGGTVTSGTGDTFRGTWVAEFDPTEEIGSDG